MLRVSTYTMYQNGEQNIMARQTELMTTQAQLSSGHRINSPADDPIGAANATMLDSGLTQLTQYQSNQSQASYLLNMGESTLSQVMNNLQSVRQSLVQAGDAAYSDSQRASIATALQQNLAQLVGLANTGDNQGGYLFAGSRNAAPPFTQNGNSVSYNGDNILQSMQVSQSRVEQVKYSGQDVFMTLPTGNGTFATAATGTNTGSGVIDAGTVTNPAALTGDHYSITFAGSGSGTTYQVVDNTTGTAVTPSAPYTSPAAISFGGMQVNVSGAPAAGDTFTVGPAGNTSIFNLLQQAVAALQTPSTSAAVVAQRSSTINSLLGSIDQAMNHISMRQSDMGSQLNELDTYASLNSDRTLQAQTRLSTIVDLDYAQGVSNLSRQQTAYQAALQSYSSVSKLSLFNYL